MAEGGEFYTLLSYPAFISEALKGFPVVRKKKVDYLDIPCSFDIESTSFYDESSGTPVKCATMYIWQFGLNGKCIMGRTWEEFTELLRALEKDLEIAPKKRVLVCYVHNLAFEFQFFRGLLSWVDSFAMSTREPIYALCDKGICFKCSQMLSGTSLAQVGKSLSLYKVRKLEGDLDYSLVRNSLTELSSQELQYCLNDILVVMAYIAEKIETDGSIAKIPLTKTGYVRRLCRDNCLYKDGDHKSSESGRKYLRYRALMKRMTLTPSEYKLAKRVYQGGFTHTNCFYVDRVIDRPIISYDFTSSYPYCLIAFKYPMGQGEDYDPVSLEDITEQNKSYWCMFDIAFEGLVATFSYDHYISKSRCAKIEGETVNNGRVVEADYCLTSVTGEDFEIIKKVYSWEHCTVYNFRRYPKNYLPTDFVKTVVDLYKKKTTLKGVEGSEVEYALAKELLNSLYGMTVTDICRETVKYTTEWSSELPDLDKTIEIYNNTPSRFTSYLWGIACTSFARYNLWSGILECGEDYIYADTDSIKLINFEKHKGYFKRYNALVEYKLRKACTYHHIPFTDIKPKTIKGVEKLIGVWDFDGAYTRGKFLGAKRYLLEDEQGEMHLTVAGVSKKNALRYLRARYKSNDKIFEVFTDSLCVPKEYTDSEGEFNASGKNTHTYIDTPQEGYLTDYQGHTAHYKELSSVHLEPTEYNLSLACSFIEYLKSIRCYAL